MVNKFISQQQFGFRPQHTTVKQTYRLVNKINNDLQFGGYYFADSSLPQDMVGRIVLQEKKTEFTLSLLRNSEVISKGRCALG